MNRKHIIEQYKSFIFDFDGVIMDSNNIKKNAIASAVTGVLDQRKASEFVKYFIRFNGIPREEKIAKFVPKKKYNDVLNRYETIIGKELFKAKLIPGVEPFVADLATKNREMIVLSGGTEAEVKELLVDRRLNTYFSEVYGGPKNKEENLIGANLKHPVLYFGDSEVDYKIARKNDFDFIFVYGATNMENWRSKIIESSSVSLIQDFNDRQVL